MLHHDLPQKLSRMIMFLAMDGQISLFINKEDSKALWEAFYIQSHHLHVGFHFPSLLCIKPANFFIPAGTSKRQHGVVLTDKIWRSRKFRMHVGVSLPHYKLNHEREIKRYPQCNFLRSFDTGKFSPFSCCGSEEFDSSLMVHSLAERFFWMDFPISSIRPIKISKKSGKKKKKTLKLNQNSNTACSPFDFFLGFDLVLSCRRRLCSS